MRRFLIITLGLALVCGAAASSVAQTPTASQSENGSQGRLVGEVTGVDVAGRSLTMKTDDGRQLTLMTDERTAIFRVPPGETRTENAARIALTDITTGARLFARGQVSSDGRSVVARQIVVTERGAAAASAGDDWNARGVAGRVTALNAAKKEITLFARSRGGATELTVDASGSVRFLRYAPDSLNAQDAVPSSFAELRVGDQLRARGTASADGTRLKAEEVIAGSLLRTGGTVTSVNPSAGELTLKSSQTGDSITVRVGQKSMLRRVTPEMAASFARREERREERRERRRAAGEANGERRAARDGEGEGRREPRERAGNRGAEGGARPQRAAGRGLFGMIEGLPAVALADLKKGDAVLLIASTGADASRATAITLLTGEADFINRLQSLQGRMGRDDQTGLPGNVMGGGTGPTNDREQRERERPRDPARDQP